jgi:short-subunit dehydrogenase
VKDLRSKYGDYAVVTGASAGIGEQFTRQLAAKGMNVVLVARRKDRLKALANEIAQQHGTVAEVVELDLLVEGAVDELSGAQAISMSVW